MKFLETIKDKAKTFYRRAKWATVWREDRNRRERAYLNLVEGYNMMLLRMWERLGPHNEGTPELKFMFSKSSATGMFVWRWQERDRFSHIWLLGNDAGARLFDMSRSEDVPYYISDEIIAATAIASLMTEQDDENSPEVDEETVNGVLARYYEWQDYNPGEISGIWSSRLNTMVCNYWRTAPVARRAVELSTEKQLEISNAFKLALDEVIVPELPTCMRSNNGDGRMNMSYPGSYFYTIDHHGVAICREFPNEPLNLSDYETMLTVAATIYRDITGNKDQNDEGIGGASFLLEKEPEWDYENSFPWERSDREPEKAEAT